VNASKGKANRSSSLVVLPLENLSGDREQDYFADGMTDDLIANLAKIRSLRVISRSTRWLIRELTSRCLRLRRS